MLIALAFREPDVDAFLHSITHEQFEEWTALFYLHPQGWDAMNKVAARVAWAAVRSRSAKPVNETEFTIRIAIDPADMPNTVAAIAEAQAIRGRLLKGMDHGD